MKPINILATELLNVKEQVEVKTDDWGYETVNLYSNELDACWVGEKDHLPEKVMVDTAICILQENEYVVFRVWEESNRNILRIGTLKNGHLIYLEVSSG